LSIFAKDLDMELKDFGVRAMCLSPGGTATPLTVKRTVIKKDGSPYSKRLSKAVSTISKIESDGADANSVAEDIADVICSGHAPVDGVLGIGNKLADYFYRLTPAKLSNWIVKTVFDPFDLGERRERPVKPCKGFSGSFRRG
jgi:short-subunit dehydrogenase